MYRYNPLKHRIFPLEDISVGKMLKEELIDEFPDLFIYYNLRAGNYVIGEWIKKDCEFAELYVIGPLLQFFDYEDKLIICAKLLMNKDREDFIQKMSDDEYEQMKVLDEEGERWKEKQRRAQSKRVMVVKPRIIC